MHAQDDLGDDLGDEGQVHDCKGMRRRGAPFPVQVRDEEIANLGGSLGFREE